MFTTMSRDALVKALTARVPVPPKNSERSLHLANSTRYVVSGHLAYMTARDNLIPIVGCFQREAARGTATPSMQDFLTNCLPEKHDAVMHQFSAFLAIMEPISKFCNLLGDSAVFGSIPTSQHVFCHKETLLDELHSIAENNGLFCYAKVLADELEKRFNEPINLPRFWYALVMLDPNHVTQFQLEEATAEWMTECTEISFPTSEWNMYRNNVIAWSTADNRRWGPAIEFWETGDIVKHMPTLAPVARSLLWLPTAVFLADAAFSAETHLFNKRRAALSQETAKDHLFIYVNGDVLDWCGKGASCMKKSAARRIHSESSQHAQQGGTDSDSDVEADIAAASASFEADGSDSDDAEM